MFNLISCTFSTVVWKIYFKCLKTCYILRNHLNGLFDSSFMLTLTDWQLFVFKYPNYFERSGQEYYDFEFPKGSFT